MSEKKFFIVFNSRGDDGYPHGAHVVSTNIPGTQELLKSKFDPPGHTLECGPIPTTRYLLREKAGGADDDHDPKAWANYVIDYTDEAQSYDTFEEAQAALNAQPPPPEENL